MSLSRPKIKVRICLGTACFVMGAAELQATVEEIPDAWNEFFDFACVPCLNMCDKRAAVGATPYVTIDGTPYANMSREKLYRHLESLVRQFDQPTIG